MSNFFKKIASDDFLFTYMQDYFDYSFKGEAVIRYSLWKDDDDISLASFAITDDFYWMTISCSNKSLLKKSGGI